MNDKRYPKAEKHIVSLELIKIKMMIKEGRYCFYGDREKNIESLARAGILASDVKDFILGLRVEDYLNGPVDDRNTGEKDCVWEFGVKASDDMKDFYIKVMVSDEVICYSFHEQEKPFVYHYR